MCIDSGWCEKKSAMRQPSCCVLRFLFIFFKFFEKFVGFFDEIFS